MPYTILVSRTFQKTYQNLPKNIQTTIRNHITTLQEDPRTPRPTCDIKQLQDTQPKKYRLRIGEYRIIYTIDQKTIKIIELIKREKGYSQVS